MDPETGTILLAGIVGSTAYGLDGPDSDIDRLGVYAAPTRLFHGLQPPVTTNNTQITVQPDSQYHEALKLCRLLMNGNPTVNELLWLPEELYEVQNPFGDRLLEIRWAFLSANQVRASYLGYASQQLVRMTGRHKDFKASIADPDPDAVAKRLKSQKKNARHLLRLLDQGLHLYRTGELIIPVDDPKRYFDFGEDAVRDPSVATAHLTSAHEAYDRQQTVLPEHCDVDVIEEWLQSVRDHY
jgi:hypothetical protein